MYSKAKYVFVFILVMGFCQAYGQQSETIEPAQNGVVKDIQYAQEKGGELQNKVFTNIDSLSNKSANLLQTTIDSLNNLSSKIEEKVQSKIDSLQQRLNEIQSKGSQQLANATEKTDKLTRRIDSLQARLIGKLKNPPLIPPRRGIIRYPMESRLNNEILSQPQHDHGLKGQGINLLTGRVDEQIRGMGTSGRLRQLGELDPSQIDQIADARASQMAELRELGAQAEELEGLPPCGWSPVGGKGLPEEMLTDLKRYQDEQALKQELKQRAVQKATDYLAGHMDKLTKAQGAMSALKKKYSYVPDSRDLSTAVKNTSLKNEPLKRRFRYGLGFQVHRTDPVSLDLSPNVQYRFNKLFSAGISGTYRANLQIENNTAKAAQALPDIYGVSALARYRLSFIKPGNKWLGGFFAHAEFEYMSARPRGLKTGNQTVNPTEEPARTWHPRLPIGVGKQMRLSKALTGVIIFTYDVLHDEFSPNPRAWNIKFGFMLGRFRLKDLRI